MCLGPYKNQESFSWVNLYIDSYTDSGTINGLWSGLCRKKSQHRIQMLITFFHSDMSALHFQCVVHKCL